MAGSMTRGKIIAHCVSTGQEADGVTLHFEEIAERRGKGGSVFSFGVSGRAVGHGFALIDQEEAAQVRFVFEFLDVVAVGAADKAPIDKASVVACGVLAIFRELNRETVKRTAM